MLSTPAVERRRNRTSDRSGALQRYLDARVGDGAIAVGTLDGFLVAGRAARGRPEPEDLAAVGSMLVAHAELDAARLPSPLATKSAEGFVVCATSDSVLESVEMGDVVRILDGR